MVVTVGMISSMAAWWRRGPALPAVPMVVRCHDRPLRCRPAPRRRRLADRERRGADLVLLAGWGRRQESRRARRPDRPSRSVLYAAPRRCRHKIVPCCRRSAWSRPGASIIDAVAATPIAMSARWGSAASGRGGPESLAHAPLERRRGRPVPDLRGAGSGRSPRSISACRSGPTGFRAGGVRSRFLG